MNLDELQSKISDLISDYNSKLDTLSDDRVTLADLYLARSIRFSTEDNPGMVSVVPPEFLKGLPENQPKPQSLSAAAAGLGGGWECCTVGFKGFVRNGVFMNCIPASGGECNNYTGPVRCNP
ncbi:MAG: hypothetical protein AAGB15_06725 [Pseudomonadota bacterium]